MEGRVFMLEERIIDGRKCRLFGSESPVCLLVQPSARHETAILESEAEKMAALTAHPFLLAAIELDDWMVELMPWPDRNMSRDEAAGKRAQETLQYILSSLIPVLQKEYGPLPVVLGGYSLGGLFALWASARTGCLKAIAAASPSVWIKDWIPFARKHCPDVEDVYLSLGEREEHVKNQAIARVGECIREQYALLQDQLGTEHCTLVWEEGNHFYDNDGRLAWAFAWCINRII